MCLQHNVQPHAGELLFIKLCWLCQVAFLSPYIQREVLHYGRGFSTGNPISLPSKVCSTLAHSL